MNKKIIVISMIMVLIITAVSFSDEIITYTVEGLKALTLQDDLDIEAAEIDLDLMQYDYEDILDEAETKSYITGGDRDVRIANHKTINVDPFVQEYKMELAALQLEVDKIDKETDIEFMTMEYLLLEKEIELNKSILDSKKASMEYVQSRYDNGLVTALDLSSAESSYQDQVITVNQLETDLESLKLDISYEIGMVNGEDFAIEGDLEISYELKFDIENYVNKEMLENLKVLEKKYELEAAEMTFTVYEDEYLETTNEYKSALYDVKIAELNLEDAEKSLEIGIKTSYNDVLAKYSTYDLNLKKLALEEKEYSNAELKFNLGLLSQEELSDAKIDLLNAEYTVTESIYNYNKAKVEFENYQ